MFPYTLISVRKKHLLDHVDLNKLGIWTKPPQQVNMAYAIPPPAKMEMDSDLWENWALFKLTLENYAAAMDIGKKAANVQVHTLLSVISKECLQIYKNLPMSAKEWVDTQKILERLTNYYEPKQNIIYQWYMFNSCTQEQGKNFDAYLIKLRHLIKTCE